MAEKKRKHMEMIKNKINYNDDGFNQRQKKAAIFNID